MSSRATAPTWTRAAGSPRRASPRWAPPVCSGSPCPPSSAASARGRAPSAWSPRSWPGLRLDGDGLRHARSAVAGDRASKTLADRDAILRAAAKGEHLTTLALSEKGSRSQFWAPVSKLAAKGDGFVTSAAKSWVTSANFADSYVSSAQTPGATSPLESTLYLARTQAAEVRAAGRLRRARAARQRLGAGEPGEPAGRRGGT